MKSQTQRAWDVLTTVFPEMENCSVGESYVIKHPTIEQAHSKLTLDQLDEYVILLGRVLTIKEKVELLLSYMSVMPLPDGKNLYANLTEPILIEGLYASINWLIDAEFPDDEIVEQVKAYRMAASNDADYAVARLIELPLMAITQPERRVLNYLLFVPDMLYPFSRNFLLTFLKDYFNADWWTTKVFSIGRGV